MATSDAPLSVPDVTLAVARAAEPAEDTLQYIFSDDFSSGDRLKTENGFFWSDAFAEKIAVSTDNPKTGTHSLKMTFPLGDTSNVEQRYNMGALYTRVVTEFDLYIPDGTEVWGGAAYYHNDGVSSDNNKIFRTWGDDSTNNTYTTSQSKMGLSTNIVATPGDSQIYFEGRPAPIDGTSTSMTRKGSPYDTFITDADRGQWMAIKIDITMATAQGANDGRAILTKNGAVILDIAIDNYVDDPAHNNAFRRGYLLGTANSGFDAETIFFIDNFKVSGVPK